MAKLQVALPFLLIIAVQLQSIFANPSKTEDQDYNEVASYEVVGSGAHSSSLMEGDDKKQTAGFYIFRRQRRSPHVGTSFYRPVYVQPVGVAPVQGYYQAQPHYYPHPQQLTNSHSQSQAISASFGGNQLQGHGGSSAISAAAASANSGTGDQYLHHGYRRK